MDIHSAEQEGKAARVTGELAPGWSVTVKLVPRGGQFEIAELRVYPSRDSRRDRWCGHPEHVPPGGLPLRRLTGDLRLSAFSEAARGIEGWEEAEGFKPPEEVRAILDRVLSWRKAAEGEDPATRLAPMAWGYVELMSLGHRNPNDLLAEQFGRPRAWAGNELYRARHIYDLLTDTSERGKPGGELTPKALTIIKHLDTRLSRNEPKPEPADPDAEEATP